MRKAVQARKSQAFRPGTPSNQDSSVKLYIAFSLYFGLEIFPATTQGILLFAEFLTREYRAPKSITNSLSSLRTFHVQRGLPAEAFDHSSLQLWKRALPFTLRDAPRPAAALPLRVLEELVQLARGRGAAGRAFAALLAVGFYSLARLSSLVPGATWEVDLTRVPLLRDVSFGTGSARLVLKWGKAAQAMGEGFAVPLLALGGRAACPVAALRGLVADLAGALPTQPLFSFRGGRSGGGWEFFTVCTARQWLRVLLQQAGLHERAFSFHSLRRGGCTLAFLQGAQRSDLQALGGWKSAAVDSYYPRFAARQRAASLLASAK